MTIISTIKSSGPLMLVVSGSRLAGTEAIFLPRIFFWQKQLEDLLPKTEYDQNHNAFSFVASTKQDHVPLLFMRKKCKAIGQDRSVISETPPRWRKGAVTWTTKMEIHKCTAWIILDVNWKADQIVCHNCRVGWRDLPEKKGAASSILCSISQRAQLWHW